MLLLSFKVASFYHPPEPLGAELGALFPLSTTEDATEMATWEQSAQGPLSSSGVKERQFLHPLKRFGFHDQEVT